MQVVGIGRDVSDLGIKGGARNAQSMSMRPFLNYFQLVIDHTKVDADLQCFPLTVRLNSNCHGAQDLTMVFDNLLDDANRKKIAVTTDSLGMNHCYVEIVYWSQAAESAILHVRVPYVNTAADLTLYFWYDVTHADNLVYVGDYGEVPAKNVWNGHYAYVGHLMAASPNSGKDSSSNGYNATEGGVIDDAVAGKIGLCVDYLGTGMHVWTEASVPNLDLGPRTHEYMISCWIQRNAAIAAGGYFFSKTPVSTLSKRQIQFSYNHANKRLTVGAGTVAVGGTINELNDVNWHHVAMRNYYDTADSTWKFAGYLDGANNISASASGTEDAEGIDPAIGARHNNDNTDFADYFKGLIDEVRISQSTIGLGGSRSAAWVKAEYNDGMDLLAAAVIP